MSWIMLHGSASGMVQYVVMVSDERLKRKKKRAYENLSRLRKEKRASFQREINVGFRECTNEKERLGKGLD